MAITVNNENQWKEIAKLLTVQNSNDFKQNLYSKKEKIESNSMQWILKHAWVKKVDQLFTYIVWWVPKRNVLTHKRNHACYDNEPVYLFLVVGHDCWLRVETSLKLGGKYVITFMLNGLATCFGIWYTPQVSLWLWP